MIKVLGPRDKWKNYQNLPYFVNTTSRSRCWSNGLSPFVVGPIKLYDGAVCEYSMNMENAWQFSKVYDKHLFFDKITDEYFEWARKGWNSNFAYRYPMGKSTKPKFSYWSGKRFRYLEAKKKLYIPLYSNAVKKTNAFKKLNDIYKKYGKLILWDFDAYDHLSLNMSLDDVFNSEDKKFGHGFVLASILEHN